MFLVNRGPNTTTEFAESKLMFTNNITDTWLNDQTPERKGEIIARQGRTKNIEVPKSKG